MAQQRGRQANGLAIAVGIDKGSLSNAFAEFVLPRYDDAQIVVYDGCIKAGRPNEASCPASPQRENDKGDIGIRLIVDGDHGFANASIHPIGCRVVTERQERQPVRSQGECVRIAVNKPTIRILTGHPIDLQANITGAKRSAAPAMFASSNTDNIWIWPRRHRNIGRGQPLTLLGGQG